MTARRAPKRGLKLRGRARATRRIIWTTRALEDLDEIGDYIARDDPIAAERWVMRLVSSAESVPLSPLAGRRVPELARDDVRETLVRAYRIVYRVHRDRIEILTVFHGHRLLPPGIVRPEPAD